MPVGNCSLPIKIHPIDGIKIGVTASGVRYKDRDDLVIISIEDHAKTSVVTTKNAFCASPVQLLRKHIKSTKNSRYLLINTGNANAGTGPDGYKRALEICRALAFKTNVSDESILPYSTGVIGETLNSKSIIEGLDDALLNLSAQNWIRGANAILTTDTIAKVASERIDVDGVTYHITGMSKGAGMIRPNMATMLGFIATDANIDSILLQSILVELVDQSFNKITVDGDTSTNDCCTLISTGKNELINSVDHPHYERLYQALKKVFIRLATLVVRDGEGATKFITVHVTGGKNLEECCDVAYAVAHSPLVKTAFFASDPNWGRILAAIGYAGIENLDTTKININLEDICICQKGQLSDDYTEEKGQEVMTRPEIQIHIDLGRGHAEDTVYTCDLSYEYVKINADYRN